MNCKSYPYSELASWQMRSLSAYNHLDRVFNEDCASYVFIGDAAFSEDALPESH